MRLKASQVRAYREQQWREQNGICPLCQHYIEPAAAVLDHNHRTGYNRAVLHRFCNSYLGKIENNIRRNCLTDAQVQNILRNAHAYMSKSLDTLHPTYRTPEEKRARAQARVKKRRAAAKANK